MSNKKGFTLSELLVVIVIVGVIAVIAIPSIISINKRINKRLYNEKVTTIVTAAELYAAENPDIFNGKSEVKVYVYQLINGNYLKIEKDANASDERCRTTIQIDGDEVNNANGCLLDPTNGNSLNTEYVLLSKQAVGVIGVFNGSEETTVEGTLVVKVCERLEDGTFVGKDANGNACTCEQIENGTIDACLITGNVKNNYLRYDNVMWRVMGIYDIHETDTNLVAKMITDDNIDIQ